MARRILKVVIVNPEAILAASKRFTEAIYKAYMESLIKEESFSGKDNQSKEKIGSTAF